ncbi:DNA polymerase V [Erwinia sp.]|uniref:DNA polymerase V n=1 Tax=Erwinia citreus TaxID=558 RepID=UPI003C775AD1
MARRDDIAAAFRHSIRIAASGKRTVETVNFVAALAKVNHDFTLAEANRWIEHYQGNFRDISTEEGERRTFHLFNPNNGGC